jgi:hypothetical protein
VFDGNMDNSKVDEVEKLRQFAMVGVGGGVQG